MELDFSNLVNLEYLCCDGNVDLYSLNISNCQKIKTLMVSDTKLSSLTIPNKAIIEEYGYGYTELSYNLNEFTSLKHLRCYGHDFNSLKLSSALKAQLVHLQCYYCNIDELNLSEYPNLEFLSCYGNNLTELDLSVVPKLDYLNCHTNWLETLDVTPLSYLNGLHCGIQKTNKPLVLTLTPEQKNRWDNDWTSQDYASNLNDNVNLNVKQ
jgi:hypothetical protein